MTRSLRVARGAAAAYTLAFVAGTLLSLERGYPAEALGIRTGNSAQGDVLVGIVGAGLAAPWSLIVGMWIAVALSPRRGRPGRRAGAWLAFLAAMLMAGAVAEPVSHRVITGELPLLDAIVAVANIALPAVMLVAALFSLIGYEETGSDGRR
ncbi:MAG: hypothetical protein ACT4OP_12105 [Actinomycetota bacterium]